MTKYQLMCPFKVVVVEEGIQITLDLFRRDVSGLASGHAEAFVELGSVHAFNKAVGAWRSDAGGAMLHVVHGEQQLVRVLVLQGIGYRLVPLF